MWIILSKPQSCSMYQGPPKDMWRVNGRKHGGRERSAHKRCASAPTTSFLERMVQRPGILEKSITRATMRDRRHSVLTRCATMSSGQCFLDAHPLAELLCSEPGFLSLHQLCKPPANIPMNSFPIQITLLVSAMYSQTPFGYEL